MHAANDAKVLALYHLKGGVGKTAAAVNLAYLAAANGLKTLVCDLDPQSATTYYFRVEPKLKGARKVLLKGGGRIFRNIKGTDYEGLDLLPADWSHRHLPAAFDRAKGSKQRLKKILEPLREHYDLIVLDCPATMTLVAENIFNAADVVLIPVVPSTLAARAYQDIRAFFARKRYDVRKIHAFFSMVEIRKRLHQATMRVMREQFDVLESCIPYTAEIESMGLSRAPVPAYLPASSATSRYRELWQEVDARLRGRVSCAPRGAEPAADRRTSTFAQDSSRKTDG